MEIIAFVFPFFPLAVFAVALRSSAPNRCAPSLFALAAAGGMLAYLAARDHALVGCAVALVGVAVAAAGLLAVILETDLRLAAAEADQHPVPTWLWRWSLRARHWREFEADFWTHVAFRDWVSELRHPGHGRGRQRTNADADRNRVAVTESLFSFQRKGRAALLIFVRHDRLGNLLEAATYDPEDYC
jgi:hypothetical protein